jgi:hypothetical protein
VIFPAEHEGLPADDACFTFDAYRRMLEVAASSEYRFATYDGPFPGDESRTCILRHDVDVDPGAAAALARIEQAAGVVATYFVMVRSPVYNTFARANQTFLREISNLGHRIGLHYDVAFRPDGRPASEWIRREAELLGAMLGVDVNVVSFHQPGLSDEDPRTISTGGLVSAYDFPGFTYVSDANKAMREGSFISLFRDARIRKIHLCIHPVWWATDDPHADVMDLWDGAILANLERSQEQILATERAYGARRVYRVGRT